MIEAEKKKEQIKELISDREKIGDDPRFKIKNVKIGEVKNEKTILDDGKF